MKVFSQDHFIQRSDIGEELRTKITKHSPRKYMTCNQKKYLDILSFIKPLSLIEQRQMLVGYTH